MVFCILWYYGFVVPANNYFWWVVQTNMTSVTRPDRDPYFLPDEAIVQLLKPHEVRHLREIFDEEMMHFDQVHFYSLHFILHTNTPCTPTLWSILLQ